MGRDRHVRAPAYAPALALFSYLFPEEILGEGFIEIATVAPRVSPFLRTPDDAAERAAAWDSQPKLNVYFGLHPRRNQTGRGRCGVSTDDDVIGFGCLACDLDVHNRDGQYRSIEEALAAFNDKLPPHLQPGAVVNSGHGVWAYWAFKELLSLEEYPAYHQTMAQIAQQLRGDTSIFDKRHIARVPGSLNRRSGRRPVRGELLQIEPSRRFSLLDFEGWLPELPAGYGNDCGGTRREGQPLPIEMPLRVRQAIEAARLKTGPIPDRKRGGILGVKVFGPCPACKAGHEPGKAWITPAGILKCYRETCPAGTKASGASEDGRPKGIPLEGWLARFFPEVKLGAGDEEQKSSRVRVTVEEARAKLPQALEEAVEHANARSGNVGGLLVSTGVGKTREALKKVVAEKGGLFLAHSHRDLDLRIREASTLGLDRHVHLRAIHRVRDWDGTPICKYADRVRQWAEHRYGPMRTLACDGCPHQFDYDGTGETCEAFAVKNVGVTFGTHAHGIGEADPDRTVIVDELPSLLVRTDVPVTEIENATLLAGLKDRRPGDALISWCSERLPLLNLLTAVIGTLEQRAGAEKPRPFPEYIGGPDLRVLFEGHAKAELGGLPGILHSFRSAHSAAAHPPLPRGADVRSGATVSTRLISFDIDDVFTALLVEGTADQVHGQTICLVIDGHGTTEPTVTIQFRRRRFDDWPESFVLLDATMSVMWDAICATLPGRDVKMIPVEADQDPASVRLLHLQTSSLLRRNLFLPRGKRLKEAAPVARVLRHIGRTLGYESATIGVVTHKPLSDLLNKCANAVESGSELQAATASERQVMAEVRDLYESRRVGRLRALHYGGQRGSNELEGFDAVAVLGEPRANWGEISQDARTLGIDPGHYAKMLLDAEVVQAVGRARALSRTPERPVTIIYAGTERPAVWKNEAVETVVLPTGGKLPNEGMLDAEDLAHRLIDVLGAVSARFIEFFAEKPNCYALLEQWLLTTYREEDLIGGCQPLPPLEELGAAKGLGEDQLRAALRRAVGDFKEVTTFDPTRPPSAGGGWRWREIRPEAALRLAKFIRDIG